MGKRKILEKNRALLEACVSAEAQLAVEQNNLAKLDLALDARRHTGCKKRAEALKMLAAAQKDEARHKKLLGKVREECKERVRRAELEGEGARFMRTGKEKDLKKLKKDIEAAGVRKQRCTQQRIEAEARTEKAEKKVFDLKKVIEEERAGSRARRDKATADRKAAEAQAEEAKAMTVEMQRVCVELENERAAAEERVTATEKERIEHESREAGCKTCIAQEEQKRRQAEKKLRDLVENREANRLKVITAAKRHGTYPAAAAGAEAAAAEVDAAKKLARDKELRAFLMKADSLRLLEAFCKGHMDVDAIRLMNGNDYRKFRVTEVLLFISQRHYVFLELRGDCRTVSSLTTCATIKML